jgi:ribosomal protein S18 acetylase RimI-like enzyme
MSITVRTLKAEDYDQWLVLWNANNQGHINHDVTAATWQRLMENQDVRGLVAEDNGVMAGLVHFILHPVTGHLKPVCYMQDVFVSPTHRRKGIGRLLVTALATAGTQEGWARMYWLAEAQNREAQALYKNLGLKLDFTLHVLPL